MSFHPIKDIEEGLELVEVLERLVRATELQDQHLSQFAANARGLWVNEIFWSGAFQLTAAAPTWTKSFQAPFAAITVDDPNSIGDLLVVTGEGPTDTVEVPGPGRWRAPKGQHRTIPLVGTYLSITSLTQTTGIAYVTVWVKPQVPGN